MKKVVLILLLLFLSSCKSNASGTAPTAKAIYLTHGPAELSPEDLQKHPEVIVVQTFDDFKKYASPKTALWVDKSAAPFNAEQEKWINEAPQAFYSIVLVGYSDPLYSFRDLLRLCCFMGPPIDREVEPGFSVIQWEASSGPTTHTTLFLQGYPQKPTVESILEITNALLEGKIKSASTATWSPNATATPGQ